MQLQKTRNTTYMFLNDLLWSSLCRLVRSNALSQLCFIWFVLLSLVMFWFHWSLKVTGFVANFVSLVPLAFQDEMTCCTHVSLFYQLHFKVGCFVWSLPILLVHVCSIVSDIRFIFCVAPKGTIPARKTIVQPLSNTNSNNIFWSINPIGTWWHGPTIQLIQLPTNQQSAQQTRPVQKRRPEPSRTKLEQFEPENDHNDDYNDANWHDLALNLSPRNVLCDV